MTEHPAAWPPEPPEDDLPPWPPEDEADDAFERALDFRRDVAEELRRLRVRSEARRLADQEAAAGRDYAGLYLRADELDSLPAARPLIDGTLTRGTYAILRGRDHTFKSFIALDWAWCLASGKPWQGLEVDPVRVLYIAGEGAHGISKRQRAWQAAWQTQIPAEMFTLRREALNLFAGGPALEELVERVSTGRYGLVVVDTLRRVSGRAEGNGTDMGVVVDNLDRIKHATLDGSVLVLAHTTKDDGDTRGFSGIEDDADTVWHAKRDADRHPLALDLKNTKMKDGPDGHVHELTLSPVLDSLVVSKHARAFLPAEDNTEADEAILAAMHDAFAQTGASVTALAEVTGMPRSTLYKARGRLLRTGQLVTHRKGGTDYLNLPGVGVESTVESHPGFHTDSTPPVDVAPTPFHTPTEHDSTPVHADSTPGFHTCPHPSPALLEPGGVESTVDETAQAADDHPAPCEVCGEPLSDLRRWNGKDRCVDCERTAAS